MDGMDNEFIPHGLTLHGHHRCIMKHHHNDYLAGVRVKVGHQEFKDFTAFSPDERDINKSSSARFSCGPLYAMPYLDRKLRDKDGERLTGTAA